MRLSRERILILVILAVTVAMWGTATAASVACVRATTQRRSARYAKPERLIIRRAKALFELRRDSSTGKWKEKELVGFSDLPGNENNWSGPVLSPDGTVLLAHSGDYFGQKTQLNQDVTLYIWNRSETKLKYLTRFQMFAGAGGPMVLDSWVPSEKLITFTVSICEGLAGWSKVRLLAGGKVAVDDAADGSYERLRKRLGSRRIVAPESYSRDGRFYAGASDGGLAVYSRRSGELRFIGISAGLWCMSFSPDSRAIAWIGEVLPRRRPWPKALEESGIDYLPELNAIGIVQLRGGTTTVWRVDDLPGHKGFGMWRDQPHTRVRISVDRRYLYTSWGDDLARFDMRKRQMTVIAKDVDGFDVVY